MNEDVSTAPSPWTNLPTSLLHAELARREQSADSRPACGSGANNHAYNTSLHVAALFQILLLSTLACSFPVIVRRFPRLPIPNYALFLSRHFGTGVLIATAFVHLLPTAFVSLTDPCLPRFWNEVYPAMAGFIAMVGVMAVVGIEMVFATKGAGHSHALDLEQLRGESGGGSGQMRRPEASRSESYKAFRQGAMGREVGDYDEGEDAVASQSLRSPALSDATDATGSLNKPLPPEPPFEDDDDLDLDELDYAVDDTQPLNGTAHPKHQPSANGRARPTHYSRQVSFADTPAHTRSLTTTNASEQRAVLQCLLLEAGILFHSVFIGMALSVSTGPAFIVLLIAISFHQTFEGLALGSRIAAISSFSTSSPKPWLMSVMYGVTTPLGQAIGLAVHTLYDPASQFGLLTVGIVNAISSGLLLYAGLVQLLAEDFLSDQSYVDLHGRRRLEACGAVVCGSMLMAFVGAFA
ncbi:hypothetical protein LTR36_003205 [Oleoguttula mirabilis]|uniref:Zinc/iron permease n=1 Tax=Oleoguttula mirabilis TaxID=1507867 RepID=A0AAV9JX89_9PEZI|nr:hypothetical protein LTR36_003205 [Oleoguttula mirabilis]